MSTRVDQLKRAVFESPGWKTAFSVLSLVGVGVFASAFVVEISTPAGIDWSKFYRVTSFYVLLAFVIVLFFYNRALYRYELAIDRFLDNDYCTAYMRSQCLPEAAQLYKEKIRNGDIGDLERAMDEFRRVLK